ncbi:hypothetical protein PSAB_21930 [Paenibacillus sabinae T27]|uniref:Uncharacterized protein n=1 Tax=Paenibacillus sabinae T27 TaxID=1268072 RepID=X4ZS44_9BACL|nr:hypothetical protein PSAB_21930 [Paenibacillus sabinae T27]
MQEWIISEPVFESDSINDMLLSPWGGHRNFAYDLTNFMKPSIIVELGSHLGGSFFSFCQSVKNSALSTKLYAVDTWQGDEHAGFYDEKVFELFKKIISAVYGNENINMIRKLFDDAVKDFEDDSVDILHIDGFHSYEAISHDYYTWISKVAANGIVLFHDIAKDTGYEAYKFWDEIKVQFPSLEFSHNWGLGILFPKGDSYYKTMVENNIKDKLKIYEFKAKHMIDSKRLKIDLSWQKEQTDKWWQEAQNYKCQVDTQNEQLKWQKEQTDYWWSEFIAEKKKSTKLLEDLKWQEDQTTNWWGKAEGFQIDLKWQKAQTDKWWAKAEELQRDLIWQKEQTDKWWESYIKSLEMSEGLEREKEEYQYLLSEKTKLINNMRNPLFYTKYIINSRGKKS